MSFETPAEEVKPMFEFETQGDYDRWVENIKDDEIDAPDGLIPMIVEGKKRVMYANEVGTFAMGDANDGDKKLKERRPDLADWLA